MRDLVQNIFRRVLVLEKKIDGMEPVVFDFDEGIAIAKHMAVRIPVRHEHSFGFHDGEAFFIRGTEPTCTYILITRAGDHKFITETTTTVEVNRDGKALKAKRK